MDQLQNFSNNQISDVHYLLEKFKDVNSYPYRSLDKFQFIIAEITLHKLHFLYPNLFQRNSHQNCDSSCQKKIEDVLSKLKQWKESFE